LSRYGVARPAQGQQEIVAIQQFVRVNQKIRAREVRVIDADGKQLGVITTSQALAVAQQRGMDLVEVAPNATPPVCRVVDFGKYKYEQEKREREARKHQHATKLKEIKIRLNIDPHDYETKVNHMRDFLGDGMKVKVTMMLRGRENAHPEYGNKMMQKIIEDLVDCGRPEVMPKLMGRSITMMISPHRGAGKKAGDQKNDNDADES
jgi:translation initiation factor IF-3